MRKDAGPIAFAQRGVGYRLAMGIAASALVWLLVWWALS